MRFTILAVLIATAIGTAAEAAPCRDDSWQPTYVHDLINRDGSPYYVMPNGSFAEVAQPYQDVGPQYCARYGVRDRRGFAGCRDYTRVQCGCDDASWGNSTCAAFLTMRGHTPGGGATGSSGEATELARNVQQERRDQNGRVTVEGAVIHNILCHATNQNFYVYEYTSRPGFRAIQPPDWGRAIGGRDFATYADAVHAACTGVPTPPPATGAQTLTVTNERAEKVRTSFATVRGATYEIEASGVFSDWGDHMDGIDPVWCYAEWRCGAAGEAWQQLRIDGQGMSELAGRALPYNPSHRYVVEVKGTGNPIELYLSDAQSSAGDNHGQITVTIRAK